MRREVVPGAQASNAVEPAQGKGREQHQRIQVAGVIGDDQVPLEAPQLAAVSRPEAMEQPQVPPQQDMDAKPYRLRQQAVMHQIEI